MKPYRYALVVFTAVVVLFPAAAADNELVKRGEYLAHVMDCTGCHTPGMLKGEPDQERCLAGSRIGFHVPGDGVSYLPNLTPGPETGLGKWSVEEIMRAVRQAERPDGSRLAPPMPWPSYSNLTDEDARALATFIKNLPPIERSTPARADDPEQAVRPFLTVQTPE